MKVPTAIKKGVRQGGGTLKGRLEHKDSRYSGRSGQPGGFFALARK